MQTSGADLVITRLLEEGNDVVFLVPGAQIDPLCQRLSEKPAPQAIVASHELSAGFMADGYARASGKIGACFGIGSCGAANMLPAAAVAAIDCSPVLFLTGNIPSDLQGCGTFQDGGRQGSDDPRVFSRFVRRSQSPGSREELSEVLSRIFETARKPFAAPVHISLPLDLQTGDVPFNRLKIAEELDTTDRQHTFRNSQATNRDTDRIGSVLARARRPCLLVGPRFNGAEASKLIREFAELFVIPVATTLSAKGILPEHHALSLGNFGFSGSQRSLKTLLGRESDLILVLGADFNERDSCCWDNRLRANGRRIVRVDSAEFNSRRFPADIECDIDCVQLIQNWIRDGGNQLGQLHDSTQERAEWVKSLSSFSRTFLPAEEPSLADGVIPLDRVVTSLRESASPDTILTVDAGFQRIFAGHYWLAAQPGTFYSACGTAPIGWAICAAIGIQLARPDQPVIVMTGDGCMTAHGMELGTMVRYRLPIVIVVCNNGAHGSVASRLPDCDLSQLADTDWVAFARSLGATGIKVCGDTQSHDSLSQVFEDATGMARQNRCPVVLDVKTPMTPALPNPEIARSVLSESVNSQESIAA